LPVSAHAWRWAATSAFFTGIPQFSPRLVLCHRDGYRDLVWRALYAAAPVPYSGQNAESVAASPLTQKPAQARRRFRARYAGLLRHDRLGITDALDQPKLGLAMLFGVGFGLLIERAQICFTSAFRDMWITGRTYMAKAIIFGMAASAIGIFSYVQLGMEPKIMWAGPNAVIGGLLFGFGIVLAGGCETGWMYRAVEGQVHYWWVGLGNVIGSTILAYFWDDFSPTLATSWDKVNLLATFGPFGGLLVTYLLLIALMLVIAWEKRFFRQKSAAMANVKETA
jgi:uncharacterized membrane protein YedE/YeeE